MVLAKLANYFILNKLAFSIQDFLQGRNADTCWKIIPINWLRISCLGFAHCWPIDAEPGHRKSFWALPRWLCPQSQGCMDTGDTRREARDCWNKTLTLQSLPVLRNWTQPSCLELSHLIVGIVKASSRLIPKSLITASFVEEGIRSHCSYPWKGKKQSQDLETIQSISPVLRKSLVSSTIAFKTGHLRTLSRTRSYPNRRPGTGKTTVITDYRCLCL